MLRFFFSYDKSQLSILFPFNNNDNSAKNLGHKYFTNWKQSVYLTVHQARRAILNEKWKYCRSRISIVVTILLRQS